jgi:hypothetical protein
MVVPCHQKGYSLDSDASISGTWIRDQMAKCKNSGAAIDLPPSQGSSPCAKILLDLEAVQNGLAYSKSC